VTSVFDDDGNMIGATIASGLVPALKSVPDRHWPCTVDLHACDGQYRPRITHRTSRIAG